MSRELWMHSEISSYLPGDYKLKEEMWRGLNLAEKNDMMCTGALKL